MYPSPRSRRHYRRHVASREPAGKAHLDIVLNGRGQMPPWRHLSDDDIAAVVNWTQVRFTNAPPQPISPADVRQRR